MAAGLMANAALYPTSLVVPADLQSAIGAYIIARDAEVSMDI